MSPQPSREQTSGDKTVSGLLVYPRNSLSFDPITSEALNQRLTQLDGVSVELHDDSVADETVYRVSIDKEPATANTNDSEWVEHGPPL